MRRISFITFVAIFIFLGLSNIASAMPQPSCQAPGNNDVFKGGDGWPFKNELPFPWKDISGLWQANLGGCVHYFAFYPSKTSQSGSKFLIIEQYNGLTCNREAVGKGFEKDRVVTAVLNSADFGAYEVSIHLFKSSDIKGFKDTSISKDSVMVLRMKLLGSKEAPRVYPMTRVVNESDLACVN